MIDLIRVAFIKAKTSKGGNGTKVVNRRVYPNGITSNPYFTYTLSARGVTFTFKTDVKPIGISLQYYNTATFSLSKNTTPVPTLLTSLDVGTSVDTATGKRMFKSLTLEGVKIGSLTTTAANLYGIREMTSDTTNIIKDTFDNDKKLTLNFSTCTNNWTIGNTTNTKWSIIVYVEEEA